MTLEMVCVFLTGAGAGLFAGFAFAIFCMRLLIGSQLRGMLEIIELSTKKASDEQANGTRRRTMWDG